MARFVDAQERGPFRSWRHEHAFSTESTGTRVTDKVSYTLPFGVFGRCVDWLVARHVLRATFAPRARATQRLLED